MSAAAIATLGDSFHVVCALNGFFVRDVAEALTYAGPPPADLVQIRDPP